jgi:lysozyme family protein
MKAIIDKIITVEGGYVNDPSDSGGETNMGVTLATARSYGYEGAMIDLPYDTAFAIYKALYWNSVRAFAMPEKVAEEVVDTAVNMGVSRASKFLQRALNILGTIELTVDGNIGPATEDALNAYLAKRDEDVLIKALNCLQGSFYIKLAEDRTKDKKFIYGWLRSRVS